MDKRTQQMGDGHYPISHPDYGILFFPEWFRDKVKSLQRMNDSTIFYV